MLPLTAWTAVWFVILARHGGIAWVFFVKGSSLIFSGNYNGHNRPGFLHLYQSYPGLQIGPLAFAVAQVIRTIVPGQPVGPDQNVVLAQLIMSAIGLATLAVIRRIVLLARPELARSQEFRWAFLAGGAVFLVAWQELAVAYGHLDDALALLLAAVAVLTAWTGRPVLTGLAVGLAADAKPWALIFVPVLLLAGGSARWRAADQAGRPIAASLKSWFIAGLCLAAVVAAAWLPFFIADPHTIRALHYTIANMPNSGLRAMGVNAARTPPWDRWVQLVVAWVLGLIVLARRRWPALLLVAAGARIALDPGSHGYYTPGILAGALLWDLLGSRRPQPVWTFLSFAALNLVPLITTNEPARGDFRLGLVIAFTLAVVAWPAQLVWNPADPGGPGHSDRGGFAAPPDPIRTQPVRPDESTLVVGVPGHDVGQPAPAHRTAI
jgi:hypothetical protein